MSGRRGRAWRWVMGVACVAALVSAGVALRLAALEREALQEAAAIARPTQDEGAAGTARVLKSIQQLKLVTVEIATHVNAESLDESWRGDVLAKVDAPVKLHFGTDLSRLRTDALRASALGNSWVVTVPPPERIATEVFGERETTDVSVGWLRSRSMAGEKQLGIARRDLYESARRIRLSETDMEHVRGQTRVQVATLVRSIVGPLSSVSVRFEDELAPSDEARRAGVGSKQ